MKLDTRSPGGLEPVLELTPLIDVVFLLLLFFMLATSFADPEREIPVDLPEAASSAEPEQAPDELVIDVLRDGVVRLGERAVERAELLAALRSAAARDPRTPVTIRGDRLAAHQAVVSVMDACGEAGLSNLAVGTIEG